MTSETQKQFSERIGRNKSYVTRLKQEGRLIITADGLVDVEASLKRIEDTSDPVRAYVAEGNAKRREELNEEKHKAVNQGHDQEEPKHAGQSYQAARAVKAKYDALTAKLEYEEASKKLLPADDVKRFVADLAATFRGAIEILKDRAAPELAQCETEDEIHRMLGDHCEQILSDMAEKIKRMDD